MNSTTVTTTIPSRSASVASSSAMAPPTNPAQNASLFLGTNPAQLPVGLRPASNVTPQVPLTQNHLLGNFAASMNPAMLFAMQQQLANPSFSASNGAAQSSPSDLAALGPKPVGDCPNDEDLIVNALFVGRQKGLNHAQALTELHTTNDHTAYQWMEYYLDHRSAIIAQVEKLSESPPPKTSAPPPVKTAKKPVFADPSPTAIPFGLTLARRSGPLKRKRKESVSSDSSRSSSPAESTSTYNPSISGSDRSRTKTKIRNRASSSSLAPSTAGGPQRKKHKTKPQPVRGRIPNAPTEEPTPSQVERAAKNRFTQEDVDFMIRFFAYHLNEDSTLTRPLVCERLAEKSPNHGKASWMSYSSQFPILDKMLKRAAGHNIPDSEFDIELYTGDANDAESDGEESSYLSSDFEHRIPWRMGNEGPGLDSTDEEKEESANAAPAARGKGRPFTLVEFRRMAKFMATYSSAEWTSMHRTDRWVPLLDKMPGRTASSLMSKYSSEDKRLLQLAKKYRRRLRQRAREAAGQA